jgi:hypothetical protein
MRHVGSYPLSFPRITPLMVSRLILNLRVADTASRASAAEFIHPGSQIDHINKGNI